MKKKGFLEIPFSWLFAIIVGIIILFLAIYMATKIVRTEQTTIDAKTGKEIGILFNPLETGFETGRTTSFTVPVDTRIYNKCENNSYFGEQIIQISQKSFGKWTETDMDIRFGNKYIFSDEYVQGREFYVFSKPFEFPFKVSDLIYLTSSEKNYCFSNSPSEIQEELNDLNQSNLLIANCPKDSVKVCFSRSSNCDININYASNSVIKNGKTAYFSSDALMYAAIFSEPEVYECHVQRLMQRTEQLARIYHDKATLISGKDCDSNLNLLGLANSAGNLGYSASLISINSIAEDIKDNNDLATCKLW